MTSVPAPPSLASLNPLSRFYAGFVAPLQGLVFLWHRPRLWIWAALPVALCTVLVVAAGVAAFWAGPAAVGLLVARPGAGFGEFLWLVAAGLTTLVLFLVAMVFLWAMSMVLAMPFYDVMAELIEQEVLGLAERPLVWRVVVRDAARSMLHTLIALAIYAPLMAIVFVVGFVPVVGPIASPIAAALVTSTFLARELLDMPLARRRLSFTVKVRFLVQHIALLEGLGTATMLLTWIPLFQLVSMPIAVVGSTLLYCRLEREGQGVPGDRLYET